MEPQNPQMPVTNQAPDNIMPPPPQKSSKVWIVLTIILAVSLIAVSAFGYYKWQQYKKLVGSLGADVNSLNAQLAAQQAAQSDKIVVTNQAKANCESQKGFTFIIGTVGTAKEKVELSEDNNSARLVASCQTGTTAVPGSSKTYVFKKSSGAWSLVITTASPITKAEGEKYTLPAAWYQSGANSTTTTAPSSTTPATPTN